MFKNKHTDIIGCLLTVFGLVDFGMTEAVDVDSFLKTPAVVRKTTDSLVAEKHLNLRYFVAEQRYIHHNFVVKQGNALNPRNSIVYLFLCFAF